MKKGFTLTEVLIATAIVGALAAIVLPHLILKMQTKILDEGFNRNEHSIQTALNIMPAVENTTFTKTTMYRDEAPEDFEDSSGAFMKKYLKMSKVCKEQHECFADSYNTYDDHNRKRNYVLPFEGSCAILKNGASICLKPQIANTPVWAIMDINGRKGPNIFGRDLRLLAFDLQTPLISTNDTTTDPEGGTTPETPTGDCGAIGGTLVKEHCFPSEGSTSYNDAVRDCQRAGMQLETDPGTLCGIASIRYGNHAPFGLWVSYWTGRGSEVHCFIEGGLFGRRVSADNYFEFFDILFGSGHICKP